MDAGHAGRLFRKLSDQESVMGKRSSFERRPQDFYPTPKAAVLPLLPWLGPKEIFCEPRGGAGELARHLEDAGHECAVSFDIERDARGAEVSNISCFITNPPWDRRVLHPIIDNLSTQHPTWLLLDADWMHTKQASPYWPRCSLIVSVGRVKWMPD